jgi:hypothetical protein
MNDRQQQPHRVTIRLTPYQARALWKLRTHALVEGQTPRTVTHVLVEAMLKEARHIEDTDELDTPVSSPSPQMEEAAPPAA